MSAAPTQMTATIDRATIATERFNLLMVTAVALTFLVTTIDGLQRIFDSGDLDGDQWKVYGIAVAGYFVLACFGNRRKA